MLPKKETPKLSYNKLVTSLVTGFGEHDLKELLNKIEDINVLYPQESMLSEFSQNVRTSVLYRAASCRDNLIPLILSYGADIHLRNESGETALHGAVSAEYRDIVRDLLGNGANINDIITPTISYEIYADLRTKEHTTTCRLDIHRCIKPLSWKREYDSVVARKRSRFQH